MRPFFFGAPTWPDAGMVHGANAVRVTEIGAAEVRVLAFQLAWRVSKTKSVPKLLAFSNLTHPMVLLNHALACGIPA